MAVTEPYTLSTGGYAWIPVSDPSLLDFPRCELLLIGAKPEAAGAHRAGSTGHGKGRLQSCSFPVHVSAAYVTYNDTCAQQGQDGRECASEGLPRYSRHMIHVCLA